MNLTIYFINTKDIDTSKLLSFLNEEEIKSLDKYSVKETKDEHLASLYLKKKYIGEFYLDNNSKPNSDKMFFNISHSKGCVALVSNEKYPIGIDIEKIRKVDEALIKYISSKEELKYIIDEESFFKVWTNKEAILKANGSGIRSNMKDIVSLPFDSKKEYKNKTYLTKTIRYLDYVISVAVESKEIDQLELQIKNINF